MSKEPHSNDKSNDTRRASATQTIEQEQATKQSAEDTASGLSRRGFVKATGGAAATLSLLPGLAACTDTDPAEITYGPLPSAKSKPKPKPKSAFDGPAQDFQDGYRHKWSWDSMVRGTHNTNCGFQTGCNFSIYTRDGKVVREEQAAIYPQTQEGLPDFNPRGCQKGCSYSELIYSPQRVEYPLKRKGERGAGSWERVSWDEALTDIADHIVDAMSTQGPDTVVIDTGTNVMGATAVASMARFMDTLDCTVLDINSEIGDDQQGALVTMGIAGGGRSGDDYFYSDLILIWGGNPAYTQIPDFHFLSEARYNGATIVAIAPDLNASAMHADIFVPIKPGTDTALALSMAKVVIDEGLHNVDMIREQTDLPYLVRKDTRKLLRESDLKKRGSNEKLYRWDLASNSLESPSAEHLALNGIVPALEGVFEVDTLDGKVEVTPAFELLKAKLMDYTPEQAAEICDVSPGMIRKLARMLAKAKAASNTINYMFSKFYHGDLAMRTQILLFLLCGQMGRKGAGYVANGTFAVDGLEDLVGDLQRAKEAKWPLTKKYAMAQVRKKLLGADPHRTDAKLTVDMMRELRMMTPAVLFWNFHADTLDVSGKDWDRELKRPVADYVKEALDKDWFRNEPGLDKTPQVMISWAGNMLRRVRNSQKLRDVLWPKLEMIVTLDLRMSSTALHSDYVLPVASAYEKPNVLVANTYVHNPFVLATDKATANYGESKDEWEISCLLVKKIEERARARGVETFTSQRDKTRRFDKMYTHLTKRGRLGEKDAEKLSKFVVEHSTNIGGTSWEQIKKDGFAPFEGVGKGAGNTSQGNSIKPHETNTPYLWHTEEKTPWFTLSGRVQFYIDHDWYLDFGEELPIHKNPPKAGGDYPLVMSGGHTRWSIHSMQRADPQLLRLQRGEPCMWIGVEAARERNIEDGDHIEVFNDVGRFTVQAKVAPSIRPGQVVMYHGWEDYQFEGGIGYRNVQASPLKPLELVGDYPYMEPVMGTRQPGGNDRDTRVEIRKV